MNVTHPIELHTERLLLTTLGRDAGPPVLDYLLRNRAFFAPWSPIFSADYFTLAGQQDRLAHDLRLLAAGSGARLWLFARADTAHARVLGDVSLSNIIRGAFQSCHLGYKIDAAVVNRGLMTEALAAVVEFAFATLHLHRVEANIIPRNAPSRRAVEKLGFLSEGVSPKYLKINGVWEDHIHYARLNPDVE